jgi:hypothetical protein
LASDALKYIALALDKVRQAGELIEIEVNDDG